MTTWHPIRDELDAIRAMETDNCIIWKYSQSKGYAKAGINGRTVNLHRLLCEEAHGPAPSKKHQAAHTCGRTLCLNVRHLRWKTAAENMADKKVHGTNNDGTKNGSAKLNWDDVRQIRATTGMAQWRIGELYGVSQSLISQILAGKIWIEARE